MTSDFSQRFFMTRVRSKLLLVSVCAAVLLPAIVFGAGVFPDVPTEHPYKDAIEALARDGIVKGNPNGNFDPDRSVNRAEMLKLLYTASGRNAEAPHGGCFKDVIRGSWYEAIVCNAAALGFVQGYSNGTFGPGNPVTRTEALKMVHTVFGFDVATLNEADKDLIKFVDISVAAWYTKYVSSAYKIGLLPIPGKIGSRFYPDKELLRGEAAAYMYNALNLRKKQQSSQSSSSSSTSVASKEFDMKSVSFPFSDNGVFIKKDPVAYAFSTTAARTMIHAKADIVGFYTSDISCRLYKLGESSFSSEYYLGIQTTNSCIVAAAVPPGNYQLQIQPTVADTSYSVEAKTAASDGNDGFMDAMSLSPTQPRTGTLVPHDLYDWYSFTVPTAMKGMLTVTGTSSLTCIVYTPLSVDQFGFSGPECNKEYDFQPGDAYMVGVARIGATDMAKQVTYTVKWQ